MEAVCDEFGSHNELLPKLDDENLQKKLRL
jgi:hypothetical protein